MTEKTQTGGPSLETYDPYDVWSTHYGVAAKRSYYKGRFSGKIAATGLALLDWLLPMPLRRFGKSERRIYPIVVAQEILRTELDGNLDSQVGRNYLNQLRAVATDPTGKDGFAWGLGFPWMSKNGLYPKDMPFITHTPYAMEALLVLAARKELREDAISIFRSTWWFLESLYEMYRDSQELALSYAPVCEPRIVVNANAYAAYAHILHALYGMEGVKETAREKTTRLVHWVVNRQQPDGSWFYYDDRKPGNFIDCFHSCFIVKNLLKIIHLMPEIGQLASPSICSGWNYIKNEFLDSRYGLCRRFTKRNVRDPFKLDLYDQAEYLGLLVDFEQIQDAVEFSQRVKENFYSKGHWYCRTDLLGRRWGRDFFRWGIVPFGYQQARLHDRLAAP